MAASSCSECDDTRWVRYFSEAMDGSVEEAFRLCPCNYEPEKKRRDEGARGKPDWRVKTAVGETVSLLSKDTQGPTI